MTNSRVLALVLASLFLFGCSGERKKEAVKKAPVQKEPVPETYRVKFETSKGDFVVAMTRAWAPLGADRFYELVRSGYYDQARFFRVVRKFVVQFGIAGKPSLSSLYRMAMIPDDPVKQSNRKGTITFATSGPSTRTTQVFINLADNSRLDRSGFAPFGKVVEGMDVVERLYAGYGDSPPRGSGPDPTLIETQGNDYLESRFPRLDYIQKATIQK